MPRTLPSVQLALALLMTAGCAAPAVIVAPVEPAILVEPETQVLVVRSGATSRSLAEFLWRASRGRLDAIHVRVVGRDPALRHAVAAAVRALGVASAKVREVHAAAAPGAVRVEATRYRAFPPDCPPVLATGPSVDANLFQPTLGCSDLANLALMVSDPADLIGNPVVPPVDGERAAIPVARYRLFGAAPGGAGSVGASASAPTR